MFKLVLSIIFIFFYNVRTGIKQSAFPSKTVFDLNKKEIKFVLNILLFDYEKILKINNSRLNLHTYYERSAEYFTYLEIEIDNKLFIVKKYRSVNSKHNEDALIVANCINNLLLTK